MIENIRLSFKGVWSHKLRSFLTMLGIIIGIAAIIAIVSTIKGTNEQIKSNLIGSGNNLVQVSLYQDSWEYEMEYNGIPDGVPTVSDEEMEKILSSSHVLSAARYLKRMDWNNSVGYGNTTLNSSQIMGIDNSYLKTADYKVVNGRGFLDEDFTYFRNVVILDEDSKEQLFEDADPIGKIVEISGTPFTVIGVTKKENKSQPKVTSLEEYWMYAGNQTNPTLFIPYTMWPNMYGFDEPQNVVVKATSTDDMTSAGRETSEIMNSYLKASENITYKADDALEQANRLQDLSKSTNTLLIWVASISLLVGGIGVMNIMLVSVTERTREIGLKKAIGAKKGRIMGQFLTEAAVLTSIGGLLGVLVGIGLAKLISRLAETPVAISVPASLIAVAFSMVIGIVFGLLPSVKAANMDPIEALRHE